MLGILTLVDITMVANLLIMVIIGGYATFVSRLDLEKEVDKPEWLNKVDAGTLKVKLSGSLVGVSGIHLLQIFINIENKNLEQVTLQIIIHVVFLVSSIALAYTETKLQRLRFLGFSEGLSYIALLGIGMPLKYMYNMPTPNLIIGSIHGI